MAIIGIDLGTTNSLVSVWKDGQSVLIPNALGEYLTPSIVSVDENGEMLVGRAAKERLITHPGRTACVFKRYMGSKREYRLGDHTLYPADLSALVLKALKADAEAFLGEPVEEAVISVPAYFNDLQRRETKLAGQLADLKVERLISEPTAAAVAYGLHKKEQDSQLLVLDLGGGTFDVSVLELFDGIMEVRSIAGDNFLGGEDFTQLLVEFFLEKTQIDKTELSLKEVSALEKQAELCKCAFTEQSRFEMVCRIGEEEHKVSVEESTFSRLAKPILDRIRRPIERALRDAALSTSDLSDIVLVGGASRMPLVRTMITKMFERVPHTAINPDEAIARGAAVAAAMKERNEELQELILTDVCPYTLGTSVVRKGSNGMNGGWFDPIIERNTIVPVSRVKNYCTIRDNQDKITVDVYQGENPRVDNNVLLGEMEVEIPLARSGRESVDVRYTYDSNSLLEVEVTVVSTGETKRTVIKNEQCGLTAEEIDERFEKLKSLKIHPRDRMENRLLAARAERLFEESTGTFRVEIQRLLFQFMQVLETQDEEKIRHAVRDFRESLDELETFR